MQWAIAVFEMYRYVHRESHDIQALVVLSKFGIGVSGNYSSTLLGPMILLPAGQYCLYIRAISSAASSRMLLN